MAVEDDEHYEEWKKLSEEVRIRTEYVKLARAKYSSTHSMVTENEKKLKEAEARLNNLINKL